MSFLDINHEGMQEMDLSEKIQIIRAAMLKANVFANKRILLLVVFLCILTLATGISLWLLTGFLTASLIGFFGTPFIALFILNKATKSLYIPFLNEAVSECDTILGNMEQRNKIKKQRNVMYIFLLAIFVLYNCYLLTLIST